MKLQKDSFYSAKRCTSEPHWALLACWIGTACFHLNAQTNVVQQPKEQGETDSKPKAVGWTPPSTDPIIAPALLGQVTNNAAFEKIKAKAEQGDAEAQYTIGGCYEAGQVVPQDYVEAVEWYRKVADQGNADAQYLLGYCFAKGQGVPQDYAEAVRWYQKAADQGKPGAQITLGDCYAKGQGVAQDFTEAVEWYRKAADRGDGIGESSLANCYAMGQGVPTNYVQAYKWYDLAVTQGDTNAIKHRDTIGHSLTLDQIAEAQQLALNAWTPADELVARRAWTEADRKQFWEIRAKAEKGDAEDQARLGLYYLLGNGLPQNYAEAVKLFQKAAEAGVPAAQLILAQLYEGGEVVPKNMKEALKCYILAANQKGAEEQISDTRVKVGVIYRDGLAGAKNPQEALKWFLRATQTDDIDSGKAEAMFLLSTVYGDGKLTPKNVKESEKWMVKAAEADSDLAKCFLSREFSYKGINTALSTNFFVDVLGRPAPTTIRKEVRDWVVREADSENSVAQYCLGVSYITAAYHEPKAEASKDYKAGVDWLRKASQLNESRAEEELGELYEGGQGVSKDTTEAAKCYERSVEQGDLNAMVRLANLYRRGDGVPKNGNRAFKLFFEVATRLRPSSGQYDSQYLLLSAQLALGEMERDGEGVPQKYVEAYAWFNLAAATGNIYAQGERDKLSKMLPPEQLAEAQRLSDTYLKGKSSSSRNGMKSPDSGSDLLATGTGFFITDDGYLISNYHVVKDAAQVRLVTSAGTIPAKVVQVDAANDLALLKADGHFAPLPVFSSRAVKLGGTVATVGFPDPGLQGFAPKLAKGIIAALSGAGDDARYFQISVPVQPGNSGGALVDGAGNVVGIVAAKLDAATALAASGALPENVNYAVKSSFLLSFLESVPGVEAKLKKPNTKAEEFTEVVKSAQDAAALVLVY